MAKKETNCSFCGRPRAQVGMLIAGLSGHICESCITQGYSIVQEEFNTKKEEAKTNKIRKDREKIASLLEKEKKNQKIIAEAQKGFDLERIQIEAALKGKINDVEEYRLKLQRAILNENVDNVIKYTGLLKEAESQAAELADLLARLPEMAQNPFTDWPTVIQRIQYLLKELDWQIPIDVLFAEKGLRLDQKNMTVTTLERMDVDANNVYITGNIMGTGTGAAVSPTLL